MAILKSARQRAVSTTKSIFGGIKSAVGKVVSGIKSIGSNVPAGSSYANVSSALGSKASSSSSSTGNAFSGTNISSLGLNRTTVPQVSPGSTGRGVVDSGPVIGTYAPSDIYSAPVTVAGGTKVSSEFFSEPPVESSISASSLSGGSSSGGSSSSSGIVNMPSANGGTNVGPINMGALIGLMSDSYDFDSSTGTFVKKEVKEDPMAVAAENRKKTLTEMLGLMPQKESVLGSEEVRAQQAEVNRRKEEVNNYTNMLNSLMVEQGQKLSGLRDVGAREGVTETVFGQQEAATNRYFAVRALPIQASIAAAQGNLSLAQDYLGQITAIKNEDITNRYNYNIAKFKAVYDIAEKEDKVILDRLVKQEDRVYQAQRDNINFAQSLMSQAFNDGNGALAAQFGSLIGDVDKIEPAVFVQRLNAIAGTVTPSNNTGSVVSQVLDGFTSLKDLTPTEALKVRTELYNRGFGSDTPPKWFLEYLKTEKYKFITPPALDKVAKEEWIPYRDSIMKNANSGSSGSANFDDL
jgi:hypothetical protein